MEVKLPRKLAHVLSAGAILVSRGDSVVPRVQETNGPDTDQTHILPDRIRDQLIEEHQLGLQRHDALIEEVLEDEKLSAEMRFVLENVHIDFVDITTGDRHVSIPGESHLMLLASTLQSEEAPSVEVNILEAYDPLEMALGSLGKLGLSIDLDSDPVHSEPMDSGTRSYYELNLDIDALAEALDLEVPKTIQPKTVIPYVAQLVVEENLNGEAHIRDILTYAAENQVIFGAADRHSEARRPANG